MKPPATQPPDRMRATFDHITLISLFELWKYPVRVRLCRR
jgi:hypothetical protein